MFVSSKKKDEHLNFGNEKLKDVKKWWKKGNKWLLFENDLKQNVKQIVCFNKKKRWAFKFLKWEVEGC